MPQPPRVCDRAAAAVPLHPAVAPSGLHAASQHLKHYLHYLITVYLCILFTSCLHDVNVI